MRAATLYSVRSTRDLDHEAVIRFSGEAPRRRAHSRYGTRAMAVFGSPPPRIMISDLSAKYGQRRNRLSVIILQATHQIAARSVTPGGISPTMTMRHRAMRSF